MEEDQNSIGLKVLFDGLQSQMRDYLAVSRFATTHPGAKGDHAEERWGEWLAEYLPKRYKVLNKAFVVDCNGAKSDQIDLIIYDRHYTPFVFKHGNICYVPAESIYAVLEVKHEFDKRSLEYAGKKAASVRRLHRTSTTYYQNDGTRDPKKPHEIIAGIVALDTEWKPALDETFMKAIHSLPTNERLEIGCCLTGGAFSIEYDPQFQIQSVDKSQPEESLIYFFLKLFMKLQKMGTVPAIDIAEYGKWLSSF